MDSNKSFRRREWLLVIALLMIAEAWILNLSARLSSDQNLLNYISFAATIASILLAVIAIIYSFVQNEASQRSAGAIAAQIEGLKQVSNQIQLSKAQLENQLDRIDLVANKLDSVHQAVAGSEAKLTGRLAEIETAIFRAVEQKPLPPDTRSKNTFNVVQATYEILRDSTYEADLMAYALYRYFELHEAKRMKWTDFNRNKYAEPIAKGGEKTFEVSFFEGYQILSMLRAFGAIDTLGARISAPTEVIAQIKSLGKRLKESFATHESYLIRKCLPEIDRAFNE